MNDSNRRPQRKIQRGAERNPRPWQTEKHFQVPVPTDGHVKYFRVKVSFQGDDGITN